MNIRHIALPLVAALSLALAACSKEEAASAPGSSTQAAADKSPIAQAQAYDVLAAQGKGFVAGAMMSANTVYVLFDPQCPHCGHLWQSSLALQGKVKFVWLPVAIMNAKSAPQGAAIMTAANPVETMTAHEQQLLGGSGGMSASADIPAEVMQTIKHNTDLLERLGATSVPFIVAKHQGSGAVITQNGAMSVEALANFLGMGQ
ncbi:thioredoxin fold domain-containing protein [Hydrogenophaga sp. BPS33]|uniref:thioredoxin fold domain-containing protein n=1 Tax=Hydrogenophaga sp. BPS33 TaxID=2651974 RepID=UPI00131FEBCF|nr:thioredoxin fold domain-containing protein [Hydrogenophaga sp. BPS33]QHE85355.1 thioredoxin fold domain-containing protein [Hydrogenophaga sp. BPS33]